MGFLLIVSSNLLMLGNVSNLGISKEGRNLPQRVSILQFLWWIEAGIQQTNSGADHGDGETSFFKISEEFSQSDVVDLETIPQFVDCHFTVRSLICSFWACNWFTATKER